MKLARGLRPLIIVGRSNMSEESLLDCAERAAIGTSRSQAQPVIRARKDEVRVWVVLAVVFPKTHAADFEPSAFVERQVPAARTHVWPVFGATHDEMKRLGHCAIVIVGGGGWQ